MADPAKALRTTDRVMDEMPLANAEPIPGIHLNRKNSDQGFDCLLYTSDAADE